MLTSDQSEEIRPAATGHDAHYTVKMNYLMRLVLIMGFESSRTQRTDMVLVSVEERPDPITMNASEPSFMMSEN